MKKIITNFFAKVAMVAGLAMVFAGNAFAQTWTHTFASPEAISNNSITVDGATWSIATTPGEGSPTMSTGNYSKTYGLKFGSSKSAYYGSVTFSTDYFSAYNVQSVSINVLNNGSKQGTLTAQQGSTSIGSKSQTFGQTWTDLTVNTNAGSGGSLSFTYSVQQAFYIHSITVVYTTGGGSTTTPSISADNVNITYDSTGGSIAYTVNDGVDGGSVTASTEATWLNLGSEASSPISFTCSANAENTSRSATVTLTYTYNTNETVTKDVTVTQAAAPVIYTTIPDLFNAATSTATNVLVTFNDWVVSGVSTNGKNVFVTDNNGNGFVIFDNNGGLGDTYAVGNILSGTAVSCNLQLYNGFAEVIGLNAKNLTISTDGTVTAANVDMADLSGINTGALVSYENLTCSVDNNKYYLSDGTTTLQVYEALYPLDSSDLEDGKTYNITGIYQQYNKTKEILPRSADDIEEYVSSEPLITVTPATVNATFDQTEASASVSYENLTISDESDFDIQFCDAQGNELSSGNEPTWITAAVEAVDPSGYEVSIVMDANDSDARSAYFKVFAMGASDFVYSNLVTVTQAKFVADYAELPFSFNGLRADIDDEGGLTQDGLGSDYTSTDAAYTHLKFDTTGDWLKLKINSAIPGTYTLAFNTKNNGFSSSTFKVQVSADDNTYTDLKVYTSIPNGTQKFDNIPENVRYIKWIYTKKSSGNVGLGNINISQPEETETKTVTASLNGEQYWATFYCSGAAYTLPAGAKAYTLNSSKKMYLLGTGSVIPANTAVIIIADTASLTLNKTEDTEVAISGTDNILHGSSYGMDLTRISGTPYVLGIKNDVLSFYKYEGTTIPANKVYYVNE